MKKYNILLLGFVIAIISGCTYTFPEPEEPTSGDADFGKVVVVGNSLSAGFMDGALYNDGQAASYANIVAQQMEVVGGGQFNQPDINAVNGFFGLSGTTVLGRLVLVNPLSPVPSPVVPGDPITAYAGGQALNNFAVPGIKLIEVDVAGYGNSTNGNPYFSRFASAENASVLGDAKAADGSFIIFWLGGNDALGYATAGATDPGSLTDAAVFDAKYKEVIADLITSGGKKGVLINVPNVQDIAYFTTVPWDAVPFDASDPVDAATIEALNQGYQAYNDGLDAMVTNMVITQEEADLRKIMFAGGSNAVVITDESLTDLTGINPALLSMRQTTANDLLTLPAGAVIPTGVGVQSPLGEEYTLTLADQEFIANRIADFNATIKTVADGSENLALFDFNGEFADFAANGRVINGSGLDGSLFPPFGAFSLDGVHPNQRGSAFVASLLIDVINGHFNSNIPNINPNDWPGNALPVPQ